MARKNNNAGQPNREAQRNRRALRVVTNTNFKRGAVFGPGSENIVRDNQPVIVAVEREKVSA